MINTISVMGFLYSGSSAVYDFIRQYEGLGYMSRDESRIFLNGLSELYEAKKSDTTITEKQRELIIQKFSGNFDPNIYNHKADAERNREMFGSIDTKKSNQLIREFIDNNTNIDEFITLSQKFVNNFVSLKLDNDIAVFNNDPGACLVSSTLLLPNNKAIIVYRDFLDQFAGQISNKSSIYPKNKKGEVDVILDNARIFVEMINNKIQIFIKDIEFIKKHKSEHLKNIKMVSFEDFVQSEEKRKEVAEFLGLCNPVNKTFFTEQSIKNIGVSIIIPQEIKKYILKNIKDEQFNSYYNIFS